MKAPSDERIKEDIERVKLYWEKGLAAGGLFVEDVHFIFNFDVIICWKIM